MKITFLHKQYVIVPLITYIFASIVGCSSKTNHKSTVDEQDSLSYVETASTDPAPLSQKEASDIIKSLLVRHSPQAETVLTKYVLSQNQPTIIAVFNETNSEGLSEFHYAIARKYGDSWQLDKATPKTGFCDYMHEYNPKYDVFKIVEIKNEQYVYFSYINNCGGTACDGFSDITFSLLNIKSGKVIHLVYSGEYKGDSDDNLSDILYGEYSNIEQLKSEAPFLTTWLVNASTNSKRIYKPTKEDFDLDAPRNFSKKWEVDNQAVIDQGIGTLTYTYYSAFIPDGLEPKDAYNVIENKTYKVFSYWRGCVTAFNKKEKKYFTLIAGYWKPELISWKNKDNNVLYITNFGSETMTINIDTGDFEISRN
ncbi:hypothetical protein HMPREF2139_04475 [Prevotella denticola DNF00960]|uniref:hypothetical protein n=1 Tax=Prevotella denticola TaxID=28129 RepID=UPI00050E1F28|nr:hypothetical protein [Prevotella denticola]KGF42100.1 hypothetical protein HMPREF2139_04475 [Prevotella denticola DNF00960]